MIWIGLAAALYDVGTPVTLLNSKNFNKIVKKSPVPVLTEFFAPWCGHCKQLKPVYEAVARKSMCIKLAAIDCDEHKETCGQYGIEGFPTIKIWKTVFKKGKKKRYSVDYKGSRSEKDIENFLFSQLSDVVKRIYIKDEPKVSKDKEWLLKSLNDFYSYKNNTLSKAFLINKKCQVDSTLKCLALDFSKKIDFAVGCSQDLISEFGTGLIVIPSQATSEKRNLHISKFKGDFRDYGALRKWLTKFKGSVKPAKPSKSDEKEEL
eukprot:NODE_114_length_19305_cov_0.149849.p9 type:complete len:263 gc:universal NODE_114_length_19305_cov_0.149849:2628-1840(-)